MSNFCMDGKNPICRFLSPFVFLLSGCDDKGEPAATGPDGDTDVDTDIDVDSDADVDTYIDTYPDTYLQVSRGNPQTATSKSDMTSDFYRSPGLTYMRPFSTIAVFSGMFLLGCGPLDQTLEDAIRATTDAKNGTKADFKRVELVGRGPLKQIYDLDGTERSECIPVQVDVSYEALSNPKSQFPMSPQHCEGIAEWNICRTRDQEGDWGPWRNVIDGYRWERICDCYK